MTVLARQSSLRAIVYGASVETGKGNSFNPVFPFGSLFIFGGSVTPEIEFRGAWVST